MRLLFSGISQRLFLIEVLPPSLNSLTYKGQRLLPSESSSKHDASSFNAQRMINSRFGPTYPPARHPSYPDECILSYPGVVFGFSKDPSCIEATIEKSLSARARPGLESDGGHRSPNAAENKPLRRLIVIGHHSPSEHAQPFLVTDAPEHDLSLPAVADGDISYVTIEVSCD